MSRTAFQQGGYLNLLCFFTLQPEAVRKSYWARHWACAVDVLELLAAESAFTHDVNHVVLAEGAEPNVGTVNVMLKDFVFKLMGDQEYWPGEQYRQGEQHRPGEHVNSKQSC